MLSLRKSNRKGFTLVELLVVVLILAILMAVALPLYLNSVKDASKKSCRANMQSIANAAQAWKVATRSPDFTAVAADPTLLNADLGAMPQCPDGTAAYTITANADGGLTVACGVKPGTGPNPGDADIHGSYTPGTDAN